MLFFLDFTVCIYSSVRKFRFQSIYRRVLQVLVFIESAVGQVDYIDRSVYLNYLLE